MPTFTLTDEQVLTLFEQLPAEAQDRMFRTLLKKRWPEWERLSRGGEVRMRELAAERGADWDKMNEQEREDFVDDLVHEDRACGR